MESSPPELSVVCKNCGAEVSPYVTECPYCGTRLRKRAPKLERVGDEVRVREGRRERRRRRAAERRERRGERFAVLADRPVATIAAILAPALLLVVGCGALGMLAADGLDAAFGDGIVVAAGGNGIALGCVAAWVVLRDAERRADPTEEYERIAVAVAAVVLL